MLVLQLVQKNNRFLKQKNRQLQKTVNFAKGGAGRYANYAKRLCDYPFESMRNALGELDLEEDATKHAIQSSLTSPFSSGSP